MEQLSGHAGVAASADSAKTAGKGQRKGMGLGGWNLRGRFLKDESPGNSASGSSGSGSPSFKEQEVTSEDNASEASFEGATTSPLTPPVTMQPRTGIIGMRTQKSSVGVLASRLGQPEDATSAEGQEGRAPNRFGQLWLERPSTGVPGGRRLQVGWNMGLQVNGLSGSVKSGSKGQSTVAGEGTVTGPVDSAFRPMSADDKKPKKGSQLIGWGSGVRLNLSEAASKAVAAIARDSNDTNSTSSVGRTPDMGVPSLEDKDSAGVCQGSTLSDLSVGVSKGEEWEGAEEASESDDVMGPTEALDQSDAEDAAGSTFEGVGYRRRSGGFEDEDADVAGDCASSALDIEQRRSVGGVRSRGSFQRTLSTMVSQGGSESDVEFSSKRSSRRGQGRLRALFRGEAQSMSPQLGSIDPATSAEQPLVPARLTADSADGQLAAGQEEQDGNRVHDVEDAETRERGTSVEAATTRSLVATVTGESQSGVAASGPKSRNSFQTPQPGPGKGVEGLERACSNGTQAKSSSSTLSPSSWCSLEGMEHVSKNGEGWRAEEKMKQEQGSFHELSPTPSTCSSSSGETSSDDIMKSDVSAVASDLADDVTSSQAVDPGHMFAIPLIGSRAEQGRDREMRANVERSAGQGKESTGKTCTRSSDNLMLAGTTVVTGGLAAETHLAGFSTPAPVLHSALSTAHATVHAIAPNTLTAAKAEAAGEESTSAEELKRAMKERVDALLRSAASKKLQKEEGEEGAKKHNLSVADVSTGEGRASTLPGKAGAEAAMKERVDELIRAAASRKQQHQQQPGQQTAPAQVKPLPGKDMNGQAEESREALMARKERISQVLQWASAEKGGKGAKAATSALATAGRSASEGPETPTPGTSDPSGQASTKLTDRALPNTLFRPSLYCADVSEDSTSRGMLLKEGTQKLPAAGEQGLSPSAPLASGELATLARGASQNMNMSLSSSMESSSGFGIDVSSSMSSEDEHADVSGHLKLKGVSGSSMSLQSSRLSMDAMSLASAASSSTGSEGFVTPPEDDARSVVSSIASSQTSGVMLEAMRRLQGAGVGPTVGGSEFSLRKAALSKPVTAPTGGANSLHLHTGPHMRMSPSPSPNLAAARRAGARRHASGGGFRNLMQAPVAQQPPSALELALSLGIELDLDDVAALQGATSTAGVAPLPSASSGPSGARSSPTPANNSTHQSMGHPLAGATCDQAPAPAVSHAVPSPQGISEEEELKRQVAVLTQRIQMLSQQTPQKAISSVPSSPRSVSSAALGSAGPAGTIPCPSRAATVLQMPAGFPPAPALMKGNLPVAPPGSPQVNPADVLNGPAQQTPQSTAAAFGAQGTAPSLGHAPATSAGRPTVTPARPTPLAHPVAEKVPTPGTPQEMKMRSAPAPAPAPASAAAAAPAAQAAGTSPASALEAEGAADKRAAEISREIDRLVAALGIPREALGHLAPGVNVSCTAPADVSAPSKEVAGSTSGGPGGALLSVKQIPQALEEDASQKLLPAGPPSPSCQPTGIDSSQEEVKSTEAPSQPAHVDKVCPAVSPLKMGEQGSQPGEAASSHSGKSAGMLEKRPASAGKGQSGFRSLLRLKQEEEEEMLDSLVVAYGLPSDAKEISTQTVRMRMRKLAALRVELTSLLKAGKALLNVKAKGPTVHHPEGDADKCADVSDDESDVSDMEDATSAGKEEGAGGGDIMRIASKLTLVQNAEADTVQATYCGEMICLLSRDTAEFVPTSSDRVYDAHIDKVIGAISEYYYASYPAP